MEGERLGNAAPADAATRAQQDAALLQQAMRLHQTGQLVEAERLYLRWLESNPGDISGTYYLAGLRDQQGRAAEAVALFQQVLQRDPRHADAWLNLGAAHKALGDLAEAARCFEQAIELRPALATSHFNLGVVLQAMRRPADALRCYEQALVLRPDHAQAHNNRGSVLAGLNRFEQALECFDRALALMPGYAEAHCNRGVAIQALKGPTDALLNFERAIRLRPDHVAAHRNRATALAVLNRLEEAVQGFDHAVALAPEDAETFNNRGNALYGLGRFAEALSSYQRSLQIEPHSADAHSNMGAVLLALRQPDEALGCFERAIALRSDFGQAYRNRGATLASLNRLDEALEDFDRALALMPTDPETLTIRGNVIYRLGHVEEALSLHRRALVHGPTNPGAHWNLSLMELRLGHFTDGWPSHEYRWKLPRSPLYRHGSIDRWSGSESVAGKRVLAWSEQGFGDTLQFCRYVPMLAARGAQVVLEVQPSLKPLLGSLAGACELRGQGEPIEACELQVPLLSLPLAFGTELRTIPARVPYLAADPAKAEYWRQRLGDRSAVPRIGIACSGSTEHSNDRNRTMRLRQFAPLYGRAQLYLVQKDVRAEDEDELRRAPIQDLRAELSDFGDTAALIECLDLVISVDTAVVHLAGALGKPVWVLLSSDADWRWMLERTDSPWYPSARLFRQPQLGNWERLIEQVAAQVGSLKPVTFA